MRALKIAGRVVSTILFAAILLVLAGSAYSVVMEKMTGEACPQMFGYSVATVVSGSMEPTLSINDVIIVKAEDDYEEGDILVFLVGDSLIAHRAIEKTEEGYVTRGDANNTADRGMVTQEHIKGRVVRVIPELGVVFQFVRSPIGIGCMLAVCVLCIMLPPLTKKDNKEGKEETESHGSEEDYE